MKNMQKNSLILFILGIVAFSLSFIIHHYSPLSDFSNGLFKGTSIGLIILSIIVSQKNRKRLATIRTK
ncbi:hypothetical protein AD998_12580 [bacterium 336/3]|nr:hypothetical protein AD998_12580 [bacterium 336/3]